VRDRHHQPVDGTAAGEIRDETAGPYPGDGSNGPNVLSESGIVRRDIRSSFGGATGIAAGVPMTLELVITDLANNRPFAGTAVYVWHCDREGRYSLYSDGVTDQNYLRGVQIAGATGRVSFTSIFPACYTGRWPHVHFEVYPDQASITDSTKAIATSQVALPEDASRTVYAQSGYESSIRTLAGVASRATTSSATTTVPFNWAPSPVTSRPGTPSRWPWPWPSTRGPPRPGSAGRRAAAVDLPHPAELRFRPSRCGRGSTGPSRPRAP
jgi:protocatechuate 3,4-dioxygenase beta subunit